MNFPCDKSVSCVSDLGLNGNSSESPDALLFFPRLPYAYPNNGVKYLTPAGDGFYPPCTNKDQATADTCASMGN